MLNLVPKEKTSKVSSSGGTKKETLIAESSSPTWNWIDKYQPKSVNDLKIHHSKLKSLRNWLDLTSRFNGRSQLPPIIVLYGVSGSGKSSAVELICKEMEIGISQWSDEMWEADFKGSSATFGRVINTIAQDIRAVQFEKKKSTITNFHSETTFVNDLFQINDETYYHPSFGKSKHMQWEEFSRQIKYPSLPLVNKGTNATVASSVVSSTPSVSNQSKQSLKRISTFSEDDDDVIDDDDTFGATTLTGIHEETHTEDSKRILLIHDPSFLYENDRVNSDSTESYQRKQDLRMKVFEHLLSIGLPIVITLSDSINREDQYQLLNQLIPASYRSLLMIEWVYWPPMTENKITKLLETIRKSEKLSSSIFTDEALQHIAVSSEGDVRHAILELQFQATVWIAQKQQRLSSSSISISQSLSSTIPTPRSSQDILSSSSTSRLQTKHSSKKVSETIDLTQDTVLMSNQTSTTVHTKRMDLWEDCEDEEEDAEVFLTSTRRRLQKKQKVEQPSYVLPSPTLTIPYPTPTNTTVASLLSTTSIHHKSIHTESITIRNKPQMIHRDTIFSSMHALGKFIHAKLDYQGHVEHDMDDIVIKSELSPEYMMSMLQWNSIENISQQLSIAEIGSSSSAYARPTVPGHDDEVDDNANSIQSAIEAIEKSLHLYSDCDLLLSRKYDPSAHLDRQQSGSQSGGGDYLGIFPDQYVTSLVARSLMVGKGKGMKEKYDAAKSIGYTGSGFQNIKGPQIAKFRAERNLRLHRMEQEKNHMLQESITTTERVLRGNMTGDEIQDPDYFSPYGAMHMMGRKNQVVPPISQVQPSAATISTICTLTMSNWILDMQPYVSMGKLLQQQSVHRIPPLSRQYQPQTMIPSSSNTLNDDDTLYIEEF